MYVRRLAQPCFFSSWLEPCIVTSAKTMWFQLSLGGSGIPGKPQETLTDAVSSKPKIFCDRAGLHEISLNSLCLRVQPSSPQLQQPLHLRGRSCRSDTIGATQDARRTCPCSWLAVGWLSAGSDWLWLGVPPTRQPTSWPANQPAIQTACKVVSGLTKKTGHRMTYKKYSLQFSHL
jgi:hypothetical protein